MTLEHGVFDHPVAAMVGLDKHGARLLNSWNACLGVSDEALEAGLTMRELVEALAPFAALHLNYWDTLPDESPAMNVRDDHVTAGDFRRAKAVLAKARLGAEQEAKS